MKTFTLLVAGALVCSASASVKDKHFVSKTKSPVAVSAIVHKGKHVVRHRAQSIGNLSLWRPLHEDVYFFDEEWLLDTQTTYTYDKFGYATEITEDFGGEFYKTINTFNDNHKVITEISQTKESEEEEFVNNTKEEHTYDNIVPDVITGNFSYQWDIDANDWVIAGNNYKRTIERDTKGNVTSVIISVLYMGTYEDTERTIISYDNTTGLANSIVEEKLVFDESNNLVWVETLKFTNIIWENTDGQIVDSATDLVLGNNRIKKATIFENGEEYGLFEVAYTDGKPDFSGTISYIDGSEITRHVYTSLDENGSFKEEFIYLFDMDGDGICTDDEVVGSGSYSETYDEKGNMTGYESFETDEDGITTQLDGLKCQYTYDPDHGEITENLISLFNYDTSEYETFLKIVCYDFIDVAEASIANAQKTSSYCATSGNTLRFGMDGMTNYSLFNMQGTLLCNGKATENATLSTVGLPAGVYILKTMGTKGNNTVKVVLH